MALTATGSATAAPWDGGWGVMHPVEQALTDVARGMIDKPDVLVVCNSPEQWAYLGKSATTWGFVSFSYNYYAGWRPGQVAWLSPLACFHLERLLTVADKSSVTTGCIVGVTTEYETQAYRVKVKRRVRVAGKWVIRRVWVTRYRDVPVNVPMYAECNDYIDKLFALQTLTHETMHLLGVFEEHIAECYGMQFLAFAATRMGVDLTLARQFASDYYNRYYLRFTPGTPYYSADCAVGRGLDLPPTTPDFPRDYSQFDPPPFKR